MSINKEFHDAGASGKLLAETPKWLAKGFKAACVNGQTELIRALLEIVKKKQQGTLDKQWDSCLELAAARGHIDVARLAIEQDVEITLTHYKAACRSGNSDLVEMLENHVHQIDGYLAAGFYDAYRCGNRELAISLLEKGASGWNECFLPAKLEGDEEMVQRMLGLGAAYWSGHHAVTLTFGDIAENHAGMQKIGSLAHEGFSKEDLESTKRLFEEKGCICELVYLNDGLKGVVGADRADDAYVLIIRDATSHLLEREEESGHTAAEDLLAEQIVLTWDTKAKMRGTVKNKNARYNLCYGEIAQEPNYNVGKGRIVAFDDVPLTQSLRKALPGYIGEKAEGLVCEGNLYYDSNNTGIGYHGDSERKKVVAVRLGTSIPLHYMWFKDGIPQGKKIGLSLQDGDMYIMGWKAVGFDWKKRKTFTLRHAAGCAKYTIYKPKPQKAKK